MLNANTRNGHRISSRQFKMLPVEIVNEIVECADARDLESLRLVNWTFCNAADDRIWKELDISLEFLGLVVKNAVFAYKISHYGQRLFSLLQYLKRISVTLKVVDVRISFGCDFTDVVDLFSFLRSKSSIKRMNLHLHTWKYSEIGQFRKAVSATLASSPFCSIELCPSISESVDSMIAAVCPYPTDRLEIDFNETTWIENLPFSLFLTYGNVIKTLKVNVRNADGIAALISYLKRCLNLETLHVAMDDFWAQQYLPHGTEVQLPDSVKKFTLVSSTNTPALTIKGSNVRSFAIDLGRLPSTVQLKFASLQRLGLKGCANATNEHLFMLSQMGSWKLLFLDTMDFAQLVRFKHLIEKTSTALDMYEAATGSFDFGFDYLDKYVGQLKALQDSLSHLNRITLKFPLLAPDKLKRFIIETICPILPNLGRLYFRLDKRESGGRGNLTKKYPFLKAVNNSKHGTLYALVPNFARLKKQLLQSQIAKGKAS